MERHAVVELLLIDPTTLLLIGAFDKANELFDEAADEPPIPEQLAIDSGVVLFFNTLLL